MHIYLKDVYNAFIANIAIMSCVTVGRSHGIPGITIAACACVPLAFDTAAQNVNKVMYNYATYDKVSSNINTRRLISASMIWICSPSVDHFPCLIA